MVALPLGPASGRRSRPRWLATWRERAPADGTAPGHLGDPAQATPGKGEFLLARYAAGVATFLERVIAWDGSSWEYRD